MAVIDVVLVLFTGGAWLLVMLVRELYKHK
jgi:hypothetical protein